jgi:protein-ribulosamine 3-kinase
MNSMDLKDLTGEILFRTTGNKLPDGKIRQEGGGCINNAVTVDTNEGFYFIKYNERTPPDMFEKEFKGLKVLKDAGVIGIPEPLGYGHVDKTGLCRV